MTTIDVLVMAHGEWLSKTPLRPPFRAINLEALPLPAGIPGQRWLSESIVFLSDELLACQADFVWITSGRHNDKWVRQEGRKTHLEDLPHFVSTDHIWCSCIGLQAEWPRDDEAMHPGMSSAIEEMQQTFGLSNRHDTAYANSLCFRRAMLPEFVRRWREMFWHFHGKYGTSLPFSVGAFDEARKGSYYYERVSMAILADWPDLTFKEIP